MLQCVKHPDQNAHHECNECGVLACPHCVRMVHAGGVDVVTCLGCGAACHPVVTGEEDALGFFERLPSAFLFPFQNKGWLLILAGVLFFWLLDALWIIPLLGLVMAVIGSGIYGGFLMHVVAQSAIGKMDDGPTWPEYQGVFSDMAEPFFRLLVFGVFLALPFAGAAYLGSTPLMIGTAIAAAAYGPMALVAVSLFKTALASLYVVPIGRAILVAPGQYAVAWVLFAILLVVGFGLSALSSADLGILASFAARFLGMYVAIVEMRVLGLLYRANSDEIGWI